MITLTRLNGSQFALNCDLIERIQETPDTTLIMIDGSRFIVTEPLALVVDRIVAYRARVIALAHGSMITPAEPPVPVPPAASTQEPRPAPPTRTTRTERR
jgi:flagellar protein FlbD